MNNPVKSDPDTSWNNGAVGFFWIALPNNNKKKKKKKMSTGSDTE